LLEDLEQWTRGGGEDIHVHVQERGKPEAGVGISSVPRSAEERSRRRIVDDNDADNCGGGGGGLRV